MRAWDRTRVAAPVRPLWPDAGARRSRARDDDPARPAGAAALLRCDQCEGPAPPDLPPWTPPDHTITPRPLTRIVPTLPLSTPLAEWQRRAAGEREPGEDG